jgi:hypothetical protein
MSDSTHSADLAKKLNQLEPKGKEPNSTRVLDSWIAQIENSLETDQGGRLSWLVASTLVTAMLQQIIDETGTSRFLLKGGTLLQHRLGGNARATKDVDGMVRGDIGDFSVGMDRVFKKSWGPLSFEHGEIEVINVPMKIIKPRRFEVLLKLRGRTWRRIKVEISPDEGDAANTPEFFVPPSLQGLGLPTPDHLVGLAMSYQIAQKIHAATDPHDPPDFINERARDVVDLLLLRELVQGTGQPAESSISSAILDIFESRATEARTLGRMIRTWPTKLCAYEHWADDYAIAAKSAGIDVGLTKAVSALNEWLEQL